MFSLKFLYRLGPLLSVTMLATGVASSVCSAQSFTSSDGGFSFTYPQRWTATDVTGGIKLVAADGSGFMMKLDAVEPPTAAGAPSSDAGLKQAAARLAAPIASGATFVRVSSVAMDHGQGASFRYKSASGDMVDVWIGVEGKHTVVLYPTKAGQPSQTIGLSVIFQTAAFADVLPKQPARQPAGQPMQDNNSSSPGAGGGPRTVLYSKQIAPILSQRCVACHSNQAASGGLSTASYNAFMVGGSRGSIIQPGNPARSSLIDYLTGAKDQMPKGSDPLTPAQINLFRTWIREGATNDLDPNSGRSSTSLANTTGNNANRARQSLAGSTTTAGRASRKGPKPMESYAGHLAVNDTSFEMRLYTNGTVTADWQFDKPSPAHYEGTYTLVTAVYNIKMDLVSGSIPGGSKSLHLIMQADGTDVAGKFGLDSTSPKYKIIGLQLAEIDNASKNNSTQGLPTNGTGTGTNSQQKRRRGQ